MSDNTEDSRLLEPITALVLGLAAVLTALAAYLSATQGGEEAEARAAAIKANSEANSAVNGSIQTYAADQAMFATWAESNYGENTELSEYLMTLMRPELKTAIEEWTADDSDAETPFEMASYVIEDDAFAEAAFADAEKQEAKAKEAADKGDAYDKAAIFLALALFFAGIATTFRRRIFSGALLGLGTISMVVGAVTLVTA
ncbi:hypothetical protein ACLM5J_09630 [Nocardioides sp. Bht2]|uniref:hypothetical protein n=1 Tax=Nocardioides sp. Bht2 TaxID=3392297 RepID=UPI0039B3E444